MTVATILHPHHPSGNMVRERVGIYGPPDAGKTHNALMRLAQWHQQLGSDAVFYIINLDDTFEELVNREEFLDLGNIVWPGYTPTDFDSTLTLAYTYHRQLREQDWLVIDPGGYVWDQAVDKYRIERVKRRAAKEKRDVSGLELMLAQNDPVEGWEYSDPNSWYRMFAVDLMTHGPGHRMMIYHSDALITPTEEMKKKEDETTRTTREMFAHVGEKPRGQKHDPGRLKSILHMSSTYSGYPEFGQRVVTGREKIPGRRRLGREIKGSEKVVGEEIGDLYMEYFVAVGGWKV